VSARAKPAQTKRTRRARLSRDDWLALGLKRLTRHGAGALKLEALCAAAGKTRGSFYHHFADMEAFIAALLGRWVTMNTEDIIAAVEAEAARAGGPDARRAALSRLAAALDPRAETAIRRFAGANHAAEHAVGKVDRMRIDYLARLNREEFGFSRRKAQTLALIEYSAFVGAQFLAPADMARLQKDASAYMELMLEAAARKKVGR